MKNRESLSCYVQLLRYKNDSEETVDAESIEDIGKL